MREEELKREANKYRKIPERSWAKLKEDGFVTEALERPFEDEMVLYIIEKFDEFVAAFQVDRKRAKPEGRTKEVPVTVSLRPEEAERAAAFEEYLAYAANFDRDLHEFREKVLGNRLLSAEQARAFVQSPAARFFGDHRFEFGGGNIPLTGHHATLDSYKREREGQKVWHRATVSVDPPGITETLEKWTPESRHKVIRGSGNMGGGDGEPLSFVNAEGRVQTLWVWKWSPLEKLRRVTEKLAKRYRWQGAQATMFVLTGEIPAHPPLQVSYEWKDAGVGGRAVKVSWGVVTLEVAPWVSAKTANRAYRSAQKRILRRDNRPIKEKNLRLFRFVVERLEPTGLTEGGKPRLPPGEEEMTEDELIAYGAFEKKPTGSELVREWDAQPWVRDKVDPKWTYDGNTRRFWRDYNETRIRLAYSAPPLRRSSGGRGADCP